MDNTPTEEHVTHLQSQRTQISKVDRQKECATRRHVTETQDTSCRVMNEEERTEGSQRQELIYKNHLLLLTDSTSTTR